MNANVQPKGSDATAIRPFHVNVPEAQLSALRNRIKATVWPEMETVPDASQGVQLATVQNLARYPCALFLLHQLQLSGQHAVCLSTPHIFGSFLRQFSCSPADYYRVYEKEDKEDAQSAFGLAD